MWFNKLCDSTAVQTEELCMEAVKKNGYALKYVRNQTEAICIEAVKEDGRALRYVENQTDAICIEAVKQNGRALEYVTNQTEAICICAVKNNAYALKYVKNQTEAICIEALLGDFDCFEDIYCEIEYPSPQLITLLLKLYPEHNNIIMTVYATDVIENYKVGRNAIVTYIAPHLADLLYKPNSINALASYTRWHAVINSKTLFLTI